MSVEVRKAVVGILLGVLIFIIGVPVAFWFVVRAIDKALSFPSIGAEPATLILAGASALVGFFWVTWSWSYLIFVGKGLPIEVFGWALQPTTVLVTAGPYAYTRNPMVLGYLMLLLGVALLAQSIAGLIAIPILAGIAYIYVATFEEDALRERFGDDYEQYRRSVPALFPRLSAYVHGTAAPQS